MMPLRYPCLVLDHDDTVVDSIATVHHPCFQAFLSQVRPGAEMDLEEYLIENFDGTFVDMCRKRYGLTSEELDRELIFWNQYVAAHTPKAYPGLQELLWRYREAGGKICVASHSLSANILRDYRENGLPEPDLIFGWDLPPEKRKPSPYPLQEILRQYDLHPAQLLVVDDLKTGYDMASSCSADFAAAGWGYRSTYITALMQAQCSRYLTEVSQLEQLLFSSPS